MPVLWDKQELAAETAKDSCLCELMKWDNRPPWETVSHSSVEIKFFRQTFSSWAKDSRGLRWYKFETQDGKLHWKLMVPKSYRYRILSFFT